MFSQKVRCVASALALTMMAGTLGTVGSVVASTVTATAADAAELAPKAPASTFPSNYWGAVERGKYNGEYARAAYICNSGNPFSGYIAKPTLRTCMDWRLLTKLKYKKAVLWHAIDYYKYIRVSEAAWTLYRQYLAVYEQIAILVRPYGATAYDLITIAVCVPLAAKATAATGANAIVGGMAAYACHRAFASKNPF